MDQRPNLRAPDRRTGRAFRSFPVCAGRERSGNPGARSPIKRQPERLRRRQSWTRHSRTGRGSSPRPPAGRPSRALTHTRGKLNFGYGVASCGQPRKALLNGCGAFAKSKKSSKKAAAATRANRVIFQPRVTGQRRSRTGPPSRPGPSSRRWRGAAGRFPWRRRAWPCSRRPRTPGCSRRACRRRTRLCRPCPG